jgi:carboxylesterase type B
MSFKVSTLLAILLVYETAAADKFRITRPGPIVQLNSGPVQGLVEVYDFPKSVLTFKGIRYAKPPVGSLRFREALPAEPWNETFQAFSHGPQCAQLSGFSLEFEGEEDCLTLNVVTPSPRRRNSPVVVHIHGGGLHGGNGETAGIIQLHLNHHIVE